MVDTFTQKCTRCGEGYPRPKMVGACQKCGGIIKISYDYSEVGKTLDKKKIRGRPFNLWRYSELLPLSSPENVITLGEGGTPLIRSERFASKLGLRNLYFKDEAMLPTGSLKDRCATVSISKAKEAAVKSVVISSSGNAAASMSAYSARAGIRCLVFVPSSAVPSKLLQVTTYGGKVIKVNGTTGNSVKLAADATRKFGWPNVSTAAVYNPYALEGQKTSAYEMVEQLDWKTPDWLVIPVGSGNNLAGHWAGFSDFDELGFTNRRPKIAAVQAAGCAPFTEAVEKGSKPSEVQAWENPETIAGGVRDEFPYDVELALPALRESKGVAVNVTDSEIIETMKGLGADEGIYSEPTGAVAAAGLKHLVASRTIDKDELVVVMVTGSGLKDPGSLSRQFPEPPVIDADINQATKYLT
ncbi:MAG: threonine synthase [Thaumarchaeota archaeon]|nr:MAG: threonine synthase [Nitrososphaerota archaeon]